MGNGKEMMQLVLRERNEAKEQFAERIGMSVAIRDGWQIEADKTLFAAPDARIPFDLITAAVDFLDKWDIAVPLWKYNRLAADELPVKERKRTARVVGDLRVLLYAHELLFVRDSTDGRKFLAAFEAELNGSENERLAFLRALHTVKPVVCYLPITWLADILRDSQQALMNRAPMPRRRDLVHVQIRPGQYVKCEKGKEKEALAMYGVEV
jgi:hypothetical protein